MARTLPVGSGEPRSWPGACRGREPLSTGARVIMDDDLTIWLTKNSATDTSTLALPTADEDGQQARRCWTRTFAAG